MIEFLIGTKPQLYLAILVVALFLRFVCIPLIEWVIDTGERLQQRAQYREREAEYRRKFDAIARTPRRDEEWL